MPSKRSGKRPSHSTDFPKLPNDWSEFLSLLISHRVKFVLIGGHAVSVHGRPRMTEDLDVFVEASKPNARLLRRVLAKFGFGTAAPDEETLAKLGKVFMMGMLPFRIDVLTSISGVDFAEAWKTRIVAKTAVGSVPLISKALLIQNKRASARAKDLADLAALNES